MTENNYLKMSFSCARACVRVGLFEKIPKKPLHFAFS